MPATAVRTEVLVVEHARLHQPEARDRDGCTAAAETSQLRLSDGAGVGDLLVVLLDHTRGPEAIGEGQDFVCALPEAAPGRTGLYRPTRRWQAALAAAVAWIHVA